MKKNRVAIPPRVRQAVLKEFNHRCAICGADRPQLDHLDEDPSNNEPSNLLPLCPNCHLIDRHHPSAPPDVGKLKLFRRYKDPAILHAKFHPIYERLRFLHAIPDDAEPEDLRSHISELVSFVSSLTMGQFYSKELLGLLGNPPPGILAYYAKQVSDADAIRIKREYVERLRTVREAAEKLVVEMLRYQDWS